MKVISKRDIDRHIRQLLEKHRKIAAIWCIEDVQEVRPDLTAQQAWEVLQEVDRHHDAEFGITWQSLQYAADEMFGVAPETRSDEEAGV